MIILHKETNHYFYIYNIDDNYYELVDCSFEGENPFFRTVGVEIFNKDKFKIIT